MKKQELIVEYSEIFNTISSFIEANKNQITYEKLVPKKPEQQINGFIASLFNEYGVKDGLIVLEMFINFLQASLVMTSSSAKSFSAIFKESGGDIALDSALAASRAVTESCIKIHYITTVPLSIGIRYLIAGYIEQNRVFCAQQTNKQESRERYVRFIEDAKDLLVKLNLPTNSQIDSLSKADRELINDSLNNHDVVTMAHKSKVHIDGNFKKIGLEKNNFNNLVYHYTVANGFVHMNPYYISSGSKHQHFWLVTMVTPAMFINCLLLTKFIPLKKSNKLFQTLLTYSNRYKTSLKSIVSIMTMTK